MNIPYKFRFLNWLKENEVALVVDSEGKKLVLKECRFAKTLSAVSLNAKTYTKTLKKILPEFNEVEGFLTRSYVQGAVSGDTDKAFGFTSEALTKIRPEVLAESLYELNFFVNADFIKNGNLETRDASWYLNNLEQVKEAVNYHVQGGFYESLLSYIQNNFRQVNKNTNYLINGDLHPQNFFYNCLYAGEARDFMISDWDLLHINNPGFDLAVLSVWSWRDLNWFNTFSTKFMAYYQDKNADLALCLSFCQAYLAAQMIRHTTIIDENNLTEEEKANRDGLKKFSVALLKKVVR